MGDISKHFFRSDSACNCGCGQDTVDAELLAVIERIRVFFDEPILITSGNRCINYNKSINGHKNSYHTRGRAADIQVKNVKPKEVYNQLDEWYPGRFGMGNYPTFTHIDTQKLRKRW